jgi:ribonuclease E
MACGSTIGRAAGSDDALLDANDLSASLEVQAPAVRPEPSTAVAEVAAEYAAEVPQPLPAARPIVLPQAMTPAPTPAPAPARPAEPYRLPIDQLNAVASAVGLEWVHSNDDKVRAAQAAIAAEPKPVHVPRQPKPTVAIDDGPLILVETKKDLAQIRLPFDH